jgi:hypothetical protein
MGIMRRVTVILILGLVCWRPIFAQTSNGQTVNSGAIKAGVAIVIVGVGIAITYLALHDRGTIVGCVQTDNHGSSLVDAENKKSYALVTGASVAIPPGDLVKLKGKKGTNRSGEPTFEVQRLAKDYGQCTPVSRQGNAH